MGEQDGELNVAEARRAVERFVVDNDELLALEARIGRFNIHEQVGSPVAGLVGEIVQWLTQDSDRWVVSRRR